MILAPTSYIALSPAFMGIRSMQDRFLETVGIRVTRNAPARVMDAAYSAWSRYQQDNPRIAGGFLYKTCKCTEEWPMIGFYYVQPDGSVLTWGSPGPGETDAELKIRKTDTFAYLHDAFAAWTEKHRIGLYCDARRLGDGSGVDECRRGFGRTVRGDSSRQQQAVPGEDRIQSLRQP